MAANRRVDDNDDKDFTQSRAEPESTLKIKWWGVIVIILGVYAYFFTAIYNLNTRVTILETDSKYIKDTILELKCITKENNALARESNVLIKQYIETDKDNAGKNRTFRTK